MSGGEIAASVGVKFAEILVGQAVKAISRQFSYLFCYKRNTQNLRTQLTELYLEKAELELSAVEAGWNLETIAPTVRLCLDQAQDFINQGSEVLKTSEVEKGCLINLKKRYVLSRKATKLVQEIGVLKQKCANHERFSHPPPPVGIVDQSSTTAEPLVSMIDLKDGDRKKGQEKKGKAAFSKGAASTSLTRRRISMSFRTRTLTMQDVMDTLMDDGVNMIGLSGMGGVGKTTLVNEVREEVKARNLFNEVVMAVVSQNPDFLRIQGELAEMLGLKYQESTSVVARAQRLRERLTKGGRVLVILDDIWDGINLDIVGISVCKACKVIFTTRIERACNEMGAQANIKVSVLSDLESWELFKEMTGDCVENEDIEGIARGVADECGGLPLAIVTLGKALAGRAQQHVWEDALYQLRRSAVRSIPGMHGKVHSSIELSYEFLGSSHLPQAQSLLLLCCLFKEDANIPIEQLVRYCIGLQLFDDVETMERTRSRVYSLVDHLKSSSLFLDDGTEPLFQEEMFVKLHDVVRDVCLSIASREPLAYLVRHERQLKRWPHTQNPHTAISLMSDVMDELPGGLVHPNYLKLLRLQLKRNSVYVSREFFHGMEALRVLDFQEWSFGGISDCLPKTLQFLTNLRTLSLEHCTVGEDISFIGRLQNLEVLSLFMSRLDNLPSEVGQLRNLRVLDLRCEKVAPVIGTSILSRLHNLEELYMGRYDSWEGSTKEQGEGYCANITELDLLPCLTTLQIQVRNPRLLLELKRFCFEKLQRFNISTHRKMRLPGRYGIVNSLYLEDIDIAWLLRTKFHSLVSRSENLFLMKMEMGYFLRKHLSVKRLGLRSSDEPGFYLNAMNAFPNLEFLHIEEMTRLKEISYVGDNPAGSFVRLRELELSGLQALRSFWSGAVHPPSFGNLTFVQISHCEALRSLFTHNVAKCLVQLQDLFIFYADEMEGAISDEGRGDNDIEKIEFPKLSYLWFDCLPRFKSLYPVSGNEVSGDNNRATIQSLFNQQVSLPNLDMLQTRNLDSLKQIVGGQMQEGPVNKLRVIKVKSCHWLLNITDSTWLLQNLEDVVVEGCKRIESVFALEGLKAMEQNSPVILDNLETIELNDLPRLTHIWRMVPKGIKGFQNLRTLDIWACHSLTYILPLPIAKQLVNLHDLTLAFCNEMEVVIDEEEDDSCVIVFPQLQVMKLLSLNNFISFSSSSNNFEFPLLQKVEITKCQNMIIFCSGLVNAPKLEDPVDDPDINEWIWEGNLNNGFNRGNGFSHPAPPVGIVDPSSTTDEPPVCMIELKDGDRENKKAAFSKWIAPTSLTLRRISMTFRTRMLTMEKVMNALMDDGVNIIGLFGMGGVGKTTLVNEVREEVKDRNLFREVAMAVVSQNPDFLRIQGELADMLGLKYQESTSIDARAEQLRERLTKGGRVLVILDDIWDGINLDIVGIPVSNACKVIFTTRIERACNEMGAQTNIRVSVLSDLESWNLFKEMTGDCVENEDIEGIAREVVQECGGLPLAIVTWGRALAGRTHQRLWEDALSQLKMSSVKQKELNDDEKELNGRMEVGTTDEDMQDVDMHLEERRHNEEVVMKSKMETNQRLRKIGESSGAGKNDDDIITAGTSTVTPLPSTKFSPNPATE